jgi:16S rRNA A1518/A1519 N6-dimethyltransferase RsmA/KsgA/DIM1 with predicted DNA glycosylase/AP lyase activity
MYFIILILVLILTLFFIGGFYGVIWLPTRKRDYERIAGLADLRPGIVFCDIGSGTGDLLFYLSKKYKIKCIGIEVSPILYVYSKIKSLFYHNVEIKYGNLFKYDLSNVNIVYAFLHPKMYSRLKAKIDREARKGTTIILSCWPFENTNPLKVDQKDSETIYYVYKK